jgi:hypothetical protein
MTWPLAAVPLFVADSPSDNVFDRDEVVRIERAGTE